MNQEQLDQLQRTQLQQVIVIEKMITMYYFEFGRDFEFPGERHNFWEFLYVDRGEIVVVTDEGEYELKQGMMIFHKPNEHHRFYATHDKAPNLIVMTFECHSADMKGFENVVVPLEDEERNLLAQIVKEGMHAFEYPFRHPLVRRANAPIGSEQLIRCYLEALFIRLLRRGNLPTRSSTLSSLAKEKSNQDLMEQLLTYLEHHLDHTITLEELCSTFHIGRTKLKLLFKQATGLSVKSYLARERIEKSKNMIREQTYNVSEIAELLGFSSVHYFSKLFKRVVGMSPTEYARSVKVRL